MTARHVYRLDIEYPPGSRWTDDDYDDDWHPEGWEPREGRDADGAPETEVFSWPLERRFLSRSGAEARATLLRDWGATVTVVRSDPVTWPVGGAS